MLLYEYQLYKHRNVKYHLFLYDKNKQIKKEIQIICVYVNRVVKK